jgi:hypothetical protein
MSVCTETLPRRHSVMNYRVSLLLAYVTRRHFDNDEECVVDDRVMQELSQD